MVPLRPENYLRNYQWKHDPNKEISGGIVFVNDRHPDNEIYFFDNGRIDHLLKGVRIASLDSKLLGSYLAKFHKY